jgi:hypothetical protein
MRNVVVEEALEVVEGAVLWGGGRNGGTSTRGRAGGGEGNAAAEAGARAGGWAISVPGRLREVSGRRGRRRRTDLGGTGSGDGDGGGGGGGAVLLSGKGLHRMGGEHCGGPRTRWGEQLKPTQLTISGSRSDRRVITKSAEMTLRADYLTCDKPIQVPQISSCQSRCPHDIVYPLSFVHTYQKRYPPSGANRVVCTKISPHTQCDHILNPWPIGPSTPTYPISSASLFRFISLDTLCCAASCLASSGGTFDTGDFEISVLAKKVALVRP